MFLNFIDKTDVEYYKIWCLSYILVQYLAQIGPIFWFDRYRLQIDKNQEFLENYQ